MRKHGLVLLLALASIMAVSCAPSSPPAATGPAPAKGPNLLAKAAWEYSTDAGQTWTKDSPSVESGQGATILARTSFEIADPGQYAILELTHGLTNKIQRVQFSVNGQAAPAPIASVFFDTGVIPADLLKAGANALSAEIQCANQPAAGATTAAPTIHIKLNNDLRGLKAADFRLASPVLGPSQPDGFTVTCRTNMAVPVTLTVAPTAAGGSNQADASAAVTLTSSAAVIHQFNVTGLSPARAWTYSLDAGGPGSGAARVPYRKSEYVSVKLLPTGTNYRFVVMGDSRTNPNIWGQVADAVVKEDPAFVVFSGDLCSNGRNEGQLQYEFLMPGERLLSRVPFFLVPGNHENNSTLVKALFPGPAGGSDGRWTQRVGPVLLIGVDGHENWDADGENIRWLREQLDKGKDAKFVFFVDHYPAYSSGKYGAPDPKTGRLGDPGDQFSRETVLPVLTEYKVTAFFAGHAHCYERSDLPGGLTHIITGGAGAPLHRKLSDASKNNPYSKVFAGEHHYTVLEVNGDTCSFKAVNLVGKVIDQLTWQARRP